ncbi:hypothetical protein V8F20_004116 [Naviculisporaceae sp. PSN 640]
MDVENFPLLAGFEWEFLVAKSDQDQHPEDPRWFSRPPPPLGTVTPVPVPSLGGQRRGAGGRGRAQALARLYPMANDSPGRPKPSQIHTKIQEILGDHAGVLVFARKELENPPLARAVLMGSGIVPKAHVHTEFQGYSLGADNSLHAGDEDSIKWMDLRYQWTGVELKSRVFTEEEMGPTNGSEADGSPCALEIRNVCAALRSNMRLQVNKSSAFQVTISQQTEGGLNLMSLKKIVTLVWILEKPLLFALCAPHRRPGSNNSYCLPISEYSELAHGGAVKFEDEFDFGGQGENHYYWDGIYERYVGSAVEAFRQDIFTSLGGSGPGPSSSGHSEDGSLHSELETLRTHLQTLWRAKSISAVREMLNHHLPPNNRLSLAVKFLGFSAPPSSTAVEFRMHEGTLDPVLGKLWADVCMALVANATQTTGSQTSDAGGIGGNGEHDSDTFQDPEARAFSEMLMSMLHKTIGVDRNASSLATASTLLRELGIPQRQVLL